MERVTKVPYVGGNATLIAHADWVLTTPEGKDITFKRDKGVCIGLPYIDLSEQKEGLVMIETVQKNMGGHTLEQIKGAQLSRVAQGRVVHPPYSVKKKWLVIISPKIFPLVSIMFLTPLPFMVPLYPG